MVYIIFVQNMYYVWYIYIVSVYRERDPSMHFNSIADTVILSLGSPLSVACSLELPRQVPTADRTAVLREKVHNTLSRSTRVSQRDMASACQQLVIGSPSAVESAS